MKLRIATRKSALALKQTERVQDLLLAICPTLQIEWVESLTLGDQILDRSLAEVGGKGLFIKKLEEILLAGSADIAVHSLKDVPPQLEPEFCLAAVLSRDSPFDVLVSRSKVSFQDLPQGAVIGTSSVRRQAALLHARPDLNIKMLRGNVGTRLQKLAAGEYDALILAEAGLRRLGLESWITEVLPFELCLPSVGQGVIAIECLANRRQEFSFLTEINHAETEACILAERAMNQALGASCVSPVGSFARIEAGQLVLRGAVWEQDGRQKYTTLHSTAH